jgi:hypothetical protein
MTASSSVRPSTGIADPNNPSNTLLPALNNVVAVVPSTSTTYSPPLRCLVGATAGNVNLVLAGSTTPVVVALTAKVPSSPQMMIVQVRTTSTTVTNIKGLY